MKKKQSIETDLFGNSTRKPAINSRAKGVRNELMAAKVMQLWTGVKFTRVPRSGGLRWQDSQGVAADIIPELRDFPCPVVIETKHLKSLSLTSGTLRKRSIIYTVWEQVMADALRAKKLPLALLRENGMKQWRTEDGEQYQSYYFIMPAEIITRMQVYYNVELVASGVCDDRGYSLKVLHMRDVIEKVPFDKFVTLIDRRQYVEKFLSKWSTEGT